MVGGMGEIGNAQRRDAGLICRLQIQAGDSLVTSLNMTTSTRCGEEYPGKWTVEMWKHSDL